VLRWFVPVNDTMVWADSAEELASQHSDLLPKSVTFIPATVRNNPKLLAAHPEYLANLMALPLVERERLLAGNWKIRPAAGLVFNRAWFPIVDARPVPARERDNSVLPTRSLPLEQLPPPLALRGRSK
jgi:hypothetical protein